MRKILTHLIYVLVASLFCAYMINDGFYVLSKIGASKLELINRYTVIQFPRNTVIEKFKIENDIESYFFSHNQYMEATVLVPNDKIDNMFERVICEYESDKLMDVREGKKRGTTENFWFNAWIPRTVTKWFDKTDRSINFTVEKPEAKYTRVYLFVSCLGWNEWGGY